MLFGFKTKKSFNIFQSMMQKKTNGKMRTKEAPLVIILILTLQTKNDLFYEFLQSPIPIKEFEFKEKNALDLLNPKDKYTLIKEYIYEVKKWKKYSFPLFVYKYLYRKSRNFLSEFNKLCKKEKIYSIPILIESVSLYK